MRLLGACANFNDVIAAEKWCQIQLLIVHHEMSHIQPGFLAFAYTHETCLNEI